MRQTGNPHPVAPLRFLEFFAGGGMARLGLEPEWDSIFANDIDPLKCAAYRTNFGNQHLMEGSVSNLVLDDLPASRSDLAWASFPCQDLSLAGNRSGINAERSGTFFDFWRLMTGLCDQKLGPKLIVLENVPGLVTSNKGEDFRTIIELLARAGYRTGAQIIDARSFLPHSRPRLFIIGFSEETRPPQAVNTGNQNVLAPAGFGDNWVRLPAPTARCNERLRDIIDHSATWDSRDKTQKLITMMSETHQSRIKTLAETGAHRIGTGFRRTRHENGISVQRFEPRFDGIAGCLRTPAGGSSRQIVIEVKDGAINSRLMTPIEAARLMGLADDYILPERSNAALKLCGDGVCVPVVRWLSETILRPALIKERATKAA